MPLCFIYSKPNCLFDCFCILQFLSMKLEAVTSGMIPSINGFHSKEANQLALPPFDASRMMVGVQAESKSAAAGGASAGAQAEWLHMQLGGSFE